MVNSKMIPLYVRYGNKPIRCICYATGNNCKIATEYLRQLHETIEQSKKDGRVFITKESNLCEEHDCPVWKNVMLKIAEFAKQNSK